MRDVSRVIPQRENDDADEKNKTANATRNPELRPARILHASYRGAFDRSLVVVFKAVAGVSLHRNCPLYARPRLETRREPVRHHYAS